MITTKKQREKLYSSNYGYGWIVFKSGNNEITEIEIYVGLDKMLRRVGNGQPLLPISFYDDNNDPVTVER